MDKKYESAYASRLYPSDVVPSLKDESIFVLKCPSQNERELFPLDRIPYPIGSYYDLPSEWIWKSCEDANSVTWKVDKDQEIVGVSVKLKLMLEISMGFCPHLRCQLSNLTNAGESGNCPQNLCYTKLENGAPSFGACCFVNGAFNDGELIGYYNKTQRAPKPIYKRSRIVLGDKIGGKDESFASFINANMIYPGIIASQCPMPNTLLDIKQMIIEQNVSLWIQLAPFSSSGNFQQANDRNPTCLVLPNALQRLFPEQFSVSPLDLGIKLNLSVNSSVIAQTMHIRLATSFEEIALCVPSELNSCAAPQSPSPDIYSMEHIWYHHWEDFGVPPDDDFQELLEVVKRAEKVVKSGGTVVISCLSGRGRTGTLASILIGKLSGASSHLELTQIIVRMREMRDGLLELPSQYRFASRMLALSDPKNCGLWCNLRANHVILASSRVNK